MKHEENAPAKEKISTDTKTLADENVLADTKTLAVVIITKNEEKNIKRCLDSVVGWVSEILVVDSGSEDQTLPICRSYPGVRVIETEWRGFSETKNFANSLVGSDYILSLDADEAVTPELKVEILTVLRSQAPVPTRAYSIRRLNNYCGKWIYYSGWQKDYQLRLFPAKKAKWDGAEVHEKIVVDEGVEISKLESVLHHYSYYTLDEHIERVNSYTTLGAQKILAKGENFLLVKAVTRSFFRFFRHYILKLGFLDGAEGFYISCLSAFVVAIKYIKAHNKKVRGVFS